MKEKKSKELPKKIRNKLIYYTYLELKKKPTETNCLLINSMTPKELNNKYQKCSDYCVEKIETYTSRDMNNGIDNNNYFHVSVTYSSLNNNYHMLVDNKNVDQYIGQNNIVGKYYKGNTIQIRTTTDKIKYNISLNDQNNLEKKVIGANKLSKKRRAISSSLDVTKNILIEDINMNNINETKESMDNLKSNDNSVIIKKLIKDNINNEKVQSNCDNKSRKANTQKIINKNMIKLKKYCAKLILRDKRHNSKNSVANSTNKHLEHISPTNFKKRKKNEKYFRSGKDKPKVEDPPPILHPNENQNHSNAHIKLYESRHFPHKKLKSQTKIMQNFRLQIKKTLKKHKSIDKCQKEAISPKKSPKKSFSPKKFGSSKKNMSPKKGSSPKKPNILELNSNGFPASKFFNVYQKFNNKKEKGSDTVITKYVSGNKIDFAPSRRKGNLFNNGMPKLTNNNVNINDKMTSNLFRANNYGNNITKKGRFKKSLTINKMYKFKAGELLDKKINIIRLKETTKH